MTSAEIRSSFLDFFASHGHTIVPSSSLLPDSPGLLFTNAGMNQFVPIFLGDRAPDVSKWAGARPSKDTRAADTQKCIRAGGKHNDLEDVGFDTYHHTLFEMLGNWSFGDYFKKESVNWGWELITKKWGIPPKRLFATVYSPDKAKGEPSDFDQEVYDIWADIFRREGLDPKVHIVPGNKKDNFWMMGDTGPCGPCSEIHFNLLPSDDETAGRKLVNASGPRCIEIWNHVFIQFNANADGTFSPLAAKHVDTGMGFERVAGIYATTKGFKDFEPEPSNYNADIFAPLFKKIAELSQKEYRGTVPTKREGLTEQENTDIAFRVLADHARCVSCAIADGISPSNKNRGYVIRRILRRGILYGTKLGLKTGFFEQLVAPVVESLGSVFPELKQQQSIIQRVIRSEEESFGKTLERGLSIFEDRVFDEAFRVSREEIKADKDWAGMLAEAVLVGLAEATSHPEWKGDRKRAEEDLSAVRAKTRVLGAVAFELYATYGFPLDMTQLLAAECGLTVDVADFNVRMEKHKEISDQTEQEVIVAATEGGSVVDLQPTKFVGYGKLTSDAKLIDVVKTDKATFLVFDQTPFYAEMGGQAGDHGAAEIAGQNFAILDVVKDKAGRHLHKLAPACALDLSALNSQPSTSLLGQPARLGVSPLTRRAISRHHSAAHLVHWALRKVLGNHVRQAGTSKTKERLRFDFLHFEQVKPEQLREIEHLVNDKVIDNATVSYAEVPYAEVKGRPDILQFFGDKYGDRVRVVQIGGEPAKLNGYSMELCGGTHVATAGEIGLIKIVAEMAIAAGTRRIEAVAGQPAYDFVQDEEDALKTVNHKLNAGPHDVAKKLDALLAHKADLEKQLKVFQQKAAAGLADDLVAKATTRDGLKFVSAVVTADAPDSLRSLGSQVLAKLGEGVVTLGASFGDKATVVAFCSPAAIKAGHQAGKVVQELCVKLGGKGGGKPDFAMGGGKEVAKLAEILR